MSVAMSAILDAQDSAFILLALILRRPSALVRGDGAELVHIGSVDPRLWRPRAGILPDNI